MHNPQIFKAKEGLCILGSKGSSPEQKTEGCRIARSCSLFIRRTQRNSLPDWLQVMSPEGNTLETSLQSSSKEILDSTFYWKADGLSILGYEGHPFN